MAAPATAPATLMGAVITCVHPEKVSNVSVRIISFFNLILK